MAGNIIKLIFAGDASGLQGALGDATSRLGKFGKIAAGAGGVAGAGFGLALSNALDVGAAQSKLDAQLGSTGGMSQRAGAVAGQLYASAYGESLDDVGTAVRTVMQGISGMSTASDSDLQKITGQVMSVSSAFDQDLGGTVRAVDQLMRTGLVPNAQAGLDLIAAGFRSGINDADDLLDTVSEYSTQFRKLGLEGPQAFGLLSQGVKAGARDVDTVADALKEFSIIAVSGSTAAVDGFQSIGLNAKDMQQKIAAGGPTATAALGTVMEKLRGIKDPAEQSRVAFELFGTKAEDLGAALYALDPSTAVQALGDVAGAASDVDAKLSDTAQNKVTAVKRSFDMWSASLIATQGPLGDVAAGATAFGAPALSMAGSVGMVAMSFGGLAAPIGRAILAGAGWVASTIAQGAVGTASMVATAARYVAQWVVMAAGAMARAVVMAASWIVAMGPVGWVIAAVVGLVALIIANWDTVTAVTSAAWSAVTGWISGAWSTITSTVAGAAGAVLGFISNAWNTATALVGAAWSIMTSTVSGGVSNVIGFVASIPGRVVSALGNIGGLLVGAGRALIDGFLNGLRGAWNTVISWAQGAMAWLRGFWPFSPAQQGPFSGRGYVTYSGQALVGDFADSLRAGMPGVGQAAADVMSAAQGGLGGQGGAALSSPRPIGAASGARGGGRATVEFEGNLGDALATLIMQMIRTGKIQIRTA